MSFFRNWFFMYLKQPPAEVAFERKIASIGKPYRAQYPFPSLHRIVDFALHTDKVLIEVDGASHDTPVQRRKDITTSIALEKLGWRVIRFTNAEALHLDITEEVIALRLKHRPTLAELEAALQALPPLPEKHAKPRGRKRAPVPKKARKPRKAKADNNSADSTE